MDDNSKIRLWDFMDNTFGVKLLDEDINEIENIVNPPNYPITIYPEKKQEKKGRRKYEN